MSMLDLSIDELLTTTRSVRKRLDLTRLVEVEVIRECLSLYSIYSSVPEDPALEHVWDNYQVHSHITAREQGP